MVDVFQRVFGSITKIIRELWLEQNNDRYRPLQGQKRMTKIMEATQTVPRLYSFQLLIMPQHDSRYFVKSLEEMLERSAPRMLTCATRWKIGIYQSIRQVKLISKKMTVPIWKVWDQDRIDELVKKVDKKRITQSKQKKYNERRITTTLKVTNRWNSTSKATDYKGKAHSQATFDHLETFELKKNNDLFGDTFND